MYDYKFEVTKKYFAFVREEDRNILLELKTKGPSRDTFSDLSEKLKKSPSQVLLYYIILYFVVYLLKITLLLL